MQKGQWPPLPLQQICYFYCCIWFRPHRGEFAKVPYWGGIGAFGVPLFGSVPLRWPRLVVFSSSKSASQREVAARWEKGQRKPAPITAIPRLQGDFRGSFVIPLLLLGPPRLTWKAVLSVYLSRGNSAQPTEPLNSAGLLPATFKPFPLPVTVTWCRFYWGKIRFFFF